MCFQRNSVRNIRGGGEKSFFFFLVSKCSRNNVIPFEIYNNSLLLREVRPEISKYFLQKLFRRQKSCKYNRIFFFYYLFIRTLVFFANFYFFKSFYRTQFRNKKILGKSYDRHENDSNQIHTYTSRKFVFLIKCGFFFFRFDKKIIN